MSIKNTMTRMAAAVAIAGVLGGTAVAVAAPASASTIKNGWLQLCAQGNYPVFFHVLPVQLGNGGTTLRYVSPVVKPGNCYWQAVDTLNRWAQVDIVEDNNTYVGSEWYNGTVSGMGIGAEGSATSPWLETW